MSPALEVFDPRNILLQGVSRTRNTEQGSRWGCSLTISVGVGYVVVVVVVVMVVKNSFQVQTHVWGILYFRVSLIQEDENNKIQRQFDFTTFSKNLNHAGR